MNAIVDSLVKRDRAWIGGAGASLRVVRAELNRGAVNGCRGTRIVSLMRTGIFLREGNLKHRIVAAASMVLDVIALALG